MTNEETIKEAHRIQQLYKCPVAMVYVLQNTHCPFGVAIAKGVEDLAMENIPTKLRELATMIENGSLNLKLAKPTLG